MPMNTRNSFDPEKFLFRGLHPSISLGTASDRYKGWIGQIYSERLYRGKIKSRTNKVGRGTFKNEVLPTDSVREYFEHFRVLEIDYTFYAPLLEKGSPTSCAKTLADYAQWMNPGDFAFLKAPQMFFAQKLWRGKEYVPNENYLDPGAFIRQFFEPAVELLGPKLRGIIFEQEYQKTGERVPPGELARELDSFFASLPRGPGLHVELRTESYLCEPVFDILAKHGVGQVLSHWTWLPTLKRQFFAAGGNFIDSGGQALIRLMTPLGMRYQDAYARAFPFDRVIEEMLQPAMVPQAAELMWEAISLGKEINVIINNRAGGNAPLIARQLALKFVELGAANR